MCPPVLSIVKTLKFKNMAAKKCQVITYGENLIFSENIGNIIVRTISSYKKVALEATHCGFWVILKGLKWSSEYCTLTQLQF